MIKKIIFTISLFIWLSSFAQNNYFELRSYTLQFGVSAEPLHTYLSDVLIPFLNENDVKQIGVFEELGDAMPKKIYLLIPYKGIEHYGTVLKALKSNPLFQKSSATYNAVSIDKAPYSRFTTSFFNAIDGMPLLATPREGDLLFELRIYEGYNEDAVSRKIAMFNEGELTIFKDTGLHSVFFGEQVSGPNMPSLTYLISFNSMEERNTNWGKFGKHPEWKRMLGMEKYANTVSNIHRVFLNPLSYSQL